MKKARKLLSVIISVCIIVSCMTGISIPTAAAATHTPHSGSCVHEGWTEWSNKTVTPVTPGNYYLTSDIDYLWIAPAGTTNLCLNGHTIIGSIYISSDDTVLNLYDEEGNSGRIMHLGLDNAQGVCIENGTFNMYGGTITKNNHSGYAGGVHLAQGVFNMYGGVISGNVSSIAQSNNVYISSTGKFTHYDGTIDGGFYADEWYATITYDKNGGSGVTTQQYVKYKTETPLKPNAFTAPKHKVFKGWSTSPDGEIIKTINTIKDVTLYAIWEDAPTYDSLLQVIWDDNDNADGIRPDTVIATINSQGFRVTENDLWMANATGLYAEDKDEWAFLIPDNYTCSIQKVENNTIVTFTHTAVNTIKPIKPVEKPEVTVNLAQSKTTVKAGKQTKISIKKLVKVSNLSIDQKVTVSFKVPKELKYKVENGVLKVSGSKKGTYTINVTIKIKSKTTGAVEQTITKPFKLIVK